MFGTNHSHMNSQEIALTLAILGTVSWRLSWLVRLLTVMLSSALLFWKSKEELIFLFLCLFSCFYMSAAKLLQSTIGLCIYEFYNHGYYHLWEQMLWKHKLLLFGTRTEYFSSPIISRIIQYHRYLHNICAALSISCKGDDLNNKVDTYRLYTNTPSILHDRLECLWNLACTVGLGIIHLDNNDSSVQNPCVLSPEVSQTTFLKSQKVKLIPEIIMHSTLVSLPADIRNVCYS